MEGYQVPWVSNGDPERIPPIGTRYKVEEHVFFEVTGYGESKQIPHPTRVGETAYQLMLIGKFVIPAGSPINILEKLLNGEIRPSGEKWV